MTSNTVLNPSSPTMSGTQVAYTDAQIEAHADEYGITFDQAKAVLSW